MVGAQVRVPLGHRRSTVPEVLLDVVERTPGHDDASGGCVAQIVEPDALEPCPPASRLPGSPHGRPARAVGLAENQIIRASMLSPGADLG